MDKHALLEFCKSKVASHLWTHTTTKTENGSDEHHFFSHVDSDCDNGSYHCEIVLCMIMTI